MKRSIKVAFVAYDRARWGMGPTVNARRLLPELQRRGHEAVGLILHDGTGAPNAEFLRSMGVECRIAERQRYTENQIGWYLRQLAEIQPDVFVPNVSVAGWFAGHWARKAGIATVAAYRGHDGFHAAMVEQFVLGDPNWAVSGLVCVSRGAYEAVLGGNPGSTCVYHIPSGVPVPESPVSSHPSFTIVYLGRLVQHSKRIVSVVNALCRAASEIPECSIRIIGDGPDEMLARRLVAERNLGERIQFLGHVDPEALNEKLKGASVILLLSAHEGTPGALMDAMSCGIVPVCRDLPGGVRDLVISNQTGLLLGASDGIEEERKAVAAIKLLFDDGVLWHRLSRNARQHIHDGYSLEVAATRWEMLLREITAAAGRRRAIRFPYRYRLPPVHPGLAREDIRMPTARNRVAEYCRQKARGLRGRLYSGRV